MIDVEVRQVNATDGRGRKRSFGLNVTEYGLASNDGPN